MRPSLAAALRPETGTERAHARWRTQCPRLVQLVVTTRHLTWQANLNTVEKQSYGERTKRRCTLPPGTDASFFHFAPTITTMLLFAQVARPAGSAAARAKYNKNCPSSLAKRRVSSFFTPSRPNHPSPSLGQVASAGCFTYRLAAVCAPAFIHPVRHYIMLRPRQAPAPRQPARLRGKFAFRASSPAPTPTCPPPPLCPAASSNAHGHAGSA